MACLYSQKVSTFQIEPQSESHLGTRIQADNMSHMEDATSPTIAKALTDGYSDTANLAHFLSRKVLIQTITVSVGSTVNAVGSPWLAYLDNPIIKRKIENYSLLRGNMVLTFEIAGTPFHKGMFLASYQYLYFNDETYITMPPLDTTRGVDVVRRSQRPHIYLNASTNKGGTMTVPFLHPYPYAHNSDTDVISYDRIGRWHVDSIPFGLEQINGGSDDITITIFAHMTDVVLTAPTSTTVALSGSASFFELEPQSEYKSSGIVSGPASAVAEYAGMLTSVPYIRPFALATSIGASAISSIAKLFGYSKPACIDDLKRVRNTPVSNMALTDGMDASQKLTVTGKAELTVDQTTVGMPAEDNLALYYYTKKESYVRTLVWPVTATVGSCPFMVEVNPMFEFVSSDFSNDAVRIQQTSLSSVTRMFTEWSGGLRFRIQVIASQYHRGKIAVIYEPVGPLLTNPYPSNYHTIIDLAEGRDFTIDVKWQQDEPYLPVFKPSLTKFNLFSFTDVINVTPDESSNGGLYFMVVNELAVPDGVTGVDLAISVSALDDFELVNPGSEGLQLTYYNPVAMSGNAQFILEPQSAAVESLPSEENSPTAESDPVLVTDGVVSHPDEKALMYYGERVTSLRQLFKRFTFYRRVRYGVATNGTSSVNIALKALPAARGAISDGFDTVTDIGASYNLVGNHFFQHILRGYAGWRGAMRYKVLPITEFSSIRAERLTGRYRDIAVTMAPYLNISLLTPSFKDFVAEQGLRASYNSTAGTVATQNRTMDSLEFEIPYTIPANFSIVRPRYNDVGTNSKFNMYPAGDALSLNLVTFNSLTSVFDLYFATGEDVSLFGYLGACRVAIEAGIPEADPA